MKRLPISRRLRFRILSRDKFTCRFCGQHGPGVRLEIDHLQPVTRGGTNNETNLVTACYDCNQGKFTLPVDLMSLPMDPWLRHILIGVQRAHEQAMIDALDREAFEACISDNADYLCHQEMEIRDFYAEENRA